MSQVFWGCPTLGPTSSAEVHGQLFSLADSPFKYEGSRSVCQIAKAKVDKY